MNSIIDWNYFFSYLFKTLIINHHYALRTVFELSSAG